MNDRILLPDIARSLCVLEIVAFWHIFDYCAPVAWKDDFSFWTHGSLACFTFISGLFCGKKEMNFKKFYLSRMKRFLPMLAIALILFCIFQITSFKVAIITLLGISCFTPYQPLTLWYFAMIILFYWLTPILLYTKNGRCEQKTFIYRSIFVYFIFIVISSIIVIDNRIIVYYPFYVLGIIFPLKKLELFHYNYKSILLIGLVILSLNYFCHLLIHDILSDIIMAAGSMLLILSFSAFIENYGGVRMIVKFLSYISMSAYLFHRIVYLVTKRVLKEDYINICQVVLMVITLFVISYLIQKFYDRFCLLCERKFNRNF